MDPFFEAQRRRSDPNWLMRGATTNYLKDLHRSYGAGRGLTMPDNSTFQKALEYRMNEKAHYDKIMHDANEKERVLNEEVVPQIRTAFGKLRAENKELKQLISRMLDGYERPDSRSADPVGNRTMEQPISIPERGEPGAEGGEPPPREEEHEAADAGGVDAADPSEPNLG